MKENALDRTIVPLDGMSRAECIQFVKKTHGKIKWVKVGMEAFYRDGKDLIFELKNSYDLNIFLDLKLHDIPNTVSKAIESLHQLPIKFLTIHLTGGENMLSAAYHAAEKFLPDTKLLGVSYLTSLDQRDFKEIWNLDQESVKKSFENLTHIALRNKIHGMVLSAHELPIVLNVVKNVYQHPNDEFSKRQIPELVCPGIRFQDEIDNNQTQDQKRTSCPQNAFASGAHYIVMGRSLTTAKDLTQRLDQLSAISLAKHFAQSP